MAVRSAATPRWASSFFCTSFIADTRSSCCCWASAAAWSAFSWMARACDCLLTCSVRARRRLSMTVCELASTLLVTEARRTTSSGLVAVRYEVDGPAI
ncbi:Uncharacterised protein [Mycobacteroides abscessus subsp. abscessus]|nr:Uncharacterised protein [Mycobacteroides abscessus subsp. abscessus]